MHIFESDYFNKNYHGDYWQQNPPYKFHSFLKRIFLYKNNGSLLDVGCAYGAFLGETTKYFKSQGIDISSHAIKIAREYLPQNIPLTKTSFENYSGRKKFDVITMFDVLEHMENLPQVLNVIKKYLKKDGVAVIVVPVYDGPVGKLVSIVDTDTTHINKKDRDYWLKLFSENGFVIKQYEGVFRYYLFGSFYLNYVSKFMRQFSPAILLVVTLKNK